MMDSSHKRRLILGNLVSPESRIFCYVCGKQVDQRKMRSIDVGGSKILYICGRKKCEEIAKKALRRQGFVEAK